MSIDGSRVTALCERFGWSRRTLALVLCASDDDDAIGRVACWESHGISDRLLCALFSRMEDLHAARAAIVARAADEQRSNPLAAIEIALGAYAVVGPSDDAVRSALRAHDGVIAHAARALGYAQSEGLGQRLREHPELWPDDVPRRRVGRKAGLTDEAVRAALVEHGSVTRAAEALGVSSVAIYQRKSWRDGQVQDALVRNRKHTPRPISEACVLATRDAISRHSTMKEAARALGITRQGLHARLVAHPEILPDGWELSGKKGTTEKS